MTKPDGEEFGSTPDARLKLVRRETTKDPDWTSGLKRLYDSVLEEPMPDSFKDLLARLDDFKDLLARLDDDHTK